MPKKIKLNRKDIKQPDEFITISNRVFFWIVENKKAVSVIVSALAVIVLLVFGIRYYIFNKTQEATDAYYVAVQEYDEAMGKFTDEYGEEVLKKKAEFSTRFKNIAETYSRTDIASFALLRSASLSFERKAYEEALASYNTLLSGVMTKSDQYNMILESIAYCKENLGKLDEAIDYLKKITLAPLDFLKDYAFYNMGRLYRQLKKDSEAIESFKQVKEKFPDSPLAVKIEEELAVIGQ